MAIGEITQLTDIGNSRLMDSYVEWDRPSYLQTGEFYHPNFNTIYDYLNSKNKTSLTINIGSLVGRQKPAEFTARTLNYFKKRFRDALEYPDDIGEIIVTPYSYGDPNYHSFIIIDGHHRARSAGILPDKSVCGYIISNNEASSLYGLNIEEMHSNAIAAMDEFAQIKEEIFPTYLNPGLISTGIEP